MISRVPRCSLYVREQKTRTSHAERKRPRLSDSKYKGQRWRTRAENFRSPVVRVMPQLFPKRKLCWFTARTRVCVWRSIAIWVSFSIAHWSIFDNRSVKRGTRTWEASESSETNWILIGEARDWRELLIYGCIAGFFLFETLAGSSKL